MAVKDIPLELIDDNPYQPRSSYPRNKIEELAHSIKEFGLRQIPEARENDGRYQLAYGSLRLRAFRYNLKHERCVGWNTMPLDVKELSDEEMGLIGLEENLRRQDITPMDVARSVERYLTSFPETTETDLARKLNMTQGNISNMRRVLKLPELMLEKIDAGTINFTMGRELLVLADLPTAKELMSQVIAGLQFGNKTGGYPCTVEGIQKSIDYVCSYHLKPIKGGRSWGARPDFNIKDCEKCEKLLITHPDKTSTSAYCKDGKCWDEKQEAHHKAAGEAAIKKMQEDLTKRVAAETVTISQEIPTELREKPDQIDTWMEKVAEEQEALARQRQGEAELAEIEAEMEEEADRRDQEHLEEEERAEAEREIPEDILAMAREKAGTRAEVLDLKNLHGKADYTVLKGIYGRGELINLDELDECVLRCTQGFHYAYDSSYRFDGYGKDYSAFIQFVCTNPKCIAQKKGALTRKKNAAGLLRKNTEKKAIKEAIDLVGQVIKDGKQLLDEEGKFANTVVVPRATLKLVLLSHVKGAHISKYAYGGEKYKSPSAWLWDKVSAGTKEEKRNDEVLFKAVDNWDDEGLGRLVAEMAFYYLTDKGDIGTYEIKAEAPLGWLGVKVELPQGTAVVEEGDSGGES